MDTDDLELPEFREFFKGSLNVDHEEVFSNIRRNIRRHIPQVRTYDPNDFQVMLLGGGPSLAQSEPLIKRLYGQGWKVFTVNNTHNWALERGIRPSLHGQLDAREFNVRFVSAPVKTCRYLLCSQVHPAVFDALEGYDVRIFHGSVPGSGRKDEKIINRYYLGRWTPIVGGCTIGTRAVGLAYTLGIRTLRIFGMDCCLLDGEHHAYEQNENDDLGRAWTIKIGERRFKAHLWMLRQFDEWMQMASKLPEDFNFGFEGDGALAYLVKETARLGRLPEIRLEV